MSLSAWQALRPVATGATGFVGRALARALPGLEAIGLGSPDWREAIARAGLRDATIFHLAARVHDVTASGAGEALYHADNVEKTRALAEAAARARARRLVFLSSIKVNGEESVRPFRPDDPPAPADAYARSKWAAECALREVAQRQGLDVVIVRSPLVFGAGARANLAALMRLADSPWPLPFASLQNRRTLVHVDDLARMLVACAAEPRAAHALYFAGDPQSVTIARLLEAMRNALGRPARLVRVAPVLLEALATLAGQRERMRRLTRSLEVDVSATMEALPWRPQVTLDAGLAEMARAFRAAPA